jgi:DNA modification methylase
VQARIPVESRAIRRAVVLDPFCGTATTGEVAIKLGRNFVGIELYDEYAQIAEDRCRQAYIGASTKQRTPRRRAQKVSLCP